MTPYTAPARSDGSYGIVPQAPSAPVSASRPASWPGGAASAAANGQDPTGMYPSTSEYPQTNSRQALVAPPSASPYAYSAQPVSGGAPQPTGAYPQQYSQPNDAARQNFLPPPTYVPQGLVTPANGYNNAAGNVTFANQPPRPAAALYQESPYQLCENTFILGRVGSEAILAGEIVPEVNELIELNKDKIPEWQVDAIRLHYIQEKLRGAVETKLVYLDVKRTLPAESLSQLEKNVVKNFEMEVVPKRMQQLGVGDVQALDKKLREGGSSYERQKKAYVEAIVAGMWVRQKIKKNDEVTREQMLQYYTDHQDDFTSASRARWQEIMVRLSKHPNKQAAYAAIAQLGNAVMAGQPFEQVAQRGSDGPTSDQGGARDWATPGSLTSKELEKALFSMPVGQLSPIIETSNALYIIRVAEREDSKVTPFLAAQVQIKEKIVKERETNQKKEYVAELEAKIPVKTIFEDPKQAKEKLAELYGTTERR